VVATSGATHAQIALAWLLHRPGVTAPIVSATNPEQLAATMRAVDVQLDATALAKLDAASAPR
jgi:aryl-alcohol dehydrogenase-like predicted oxidoreductase